MTHTHVCEHFLLKPLSNHLSYPSAFHFSMKNVLIDTIEITPILNFNSELFLYYFPDVILLNAYFVMTQFLMQ